MFNLLKFIFMKKSKVEETRARRGFFKSASKEAMSIFGGVASTSTTFLNVSGGCGCIGGCGTACFQACSNGCTWQAPCKGGCTGGAKYY